MFLFIVCLHDFELNWIKLNNTRFISLWFFSLSFSLSFSPSLSISPYFLSLCILRWKLFTWPVSCLFKSISTIWSFYHFFPTSCPYLGAFIFDYYCFSFNKVNFIVTDIYKFPFLNSAGKCICVYKFKY